MNNNIRKNIPRQIKIMNIQDAIQSGAMALFESKYGENVRVVSFGDISSELCGGIHTEKTGNTNCRQDRCNSESKLAAAPVIRVGKGPVDLAHKRIPPFCLKANIRCEHLFSVIRLYRTYFRMSSRRTRKIEHFFGIHVCHFHIAML